jgi:hypothetical protein
MDLFDWITGLVIVALLVASCLMAWQLEQEGK